MPDHAMRHTPKLLAAIAVLSLLASHADAQSITDRFKSLFGGGASQETVQPTPGSSPSAAESDLTCPSVSIRPGASTYGVGMPGKPASGSDLRYQATITRTARECSVNSGQILARIGIQGRVIAGPAGAPGSVDIPMRVAVVSEGVSPKTIATKAFRTTVAMQPDGTVPFTLVAEDVVYPVPPGAEGDNYVFYIGFDPQALGPEPKAAKKKK